MRLDKKNIANKFAGIYEQLYNNVENDETLLKIQEEINNKIDNMTGNLQLERVTETVVSRALSMMKAGINDSIFDISSDFKWS